MRDGLVTVAKNLLKRPGTGFGKRIRTGGGASRPLELSLDVAILSYLIVLFSPADLDRERITPGVKARQFSLGKSFRRALTGSRGDLCLIVRVYRLFHRAVITR